MMVFFLTSQSVPKTVSLLQNQSVRTITSHSVPKPVILFQNLAVFFKISKSVLKLSSCFAKIACKTSSFTNTHKYKSSKYYQLTSNQYRYHTKTLRCVFQLKLVFEKISAQKCMYSKLVSGCFLKRAANRLDDKLFVQRNTQVITIYL